MIDVCKADQELKEIICVKKNKCSVLDIRCVPNNFN